MNFRSTKRAWEILVILSKHRRQSQVVVIELALESFANEQNIDISKCVGFEL